MPARGDARGARTRPLAPEGGQEDGRTTPGAAEILGDKRHARHTSHNATGGRGSVNRRRCGPLAQTTPGARFDRRLSPAGWRGIPPQSVIAEAVRDRFRVAGPSATSTRVGLGS